MSKWVKCKTVGLRYRLHTERKHGVGFDKYFTIRYKNAGKEKSEGLGWASAGWTEKKAAAVLSELKANHTTGVGAQSLNEKREIRKQERVEVEKRRKLEVLENITFQEVFAKYLVYSQDNKRSEKSFRREEQLARIHIFPVIKNLALRKITQIQLERLKKNMANEGRSPRTIRYALAVVRQVINFAIREGLFTGENPAAGGKVTRPKEDNRKDRYLSPEEADRLLAELVKRSQEVHDMSMLSLYTGMRFGEVAKLKWGNVDMFQGVIMLRNTKSNKDRAAYMTDQIKKMLVRRGAGEPDSLVFPARGKNNKPHSMISHLYYDVVGLMFNQGVADKKLWVNFHTLRHTFASWLVEKNTDLYIIKDLLGHRDLKTTERYAHIGDNQLKQAVMKLQKG